MSTDRPRSGVAVSGGQISRRGLGSVAVAATAIAVGTTLRGGAATPVADAAALGDDPAVAVREWALSQAAQTHEVIELPNATMPAGTRMLLISQMDPSRLLKVRLSGSSGLLGLTVTGVTGFGVGDSDGGLHGLALSQAYPGMVWATLEHANQLLLIDPRPLLPEQAPVVTRMINLAELAPAPAKPPAGPHYVREFGDELWVTLKGSDQVLRIPHTEAATDYTLYDVPAHPIFVAQHPGNQHFYVSCDQASRIARINQSSGEVREWAVPADKGATPAGLVAGPDGNVWFVLLGTATGGTGTFGRINADDTVEYYRLAGPLDAATPLHLAFGPGPAPAPLWLLTSSIVNPAALDSIIRVTFNTGHAAIESQSQWALPTQQNKAHRLLPVASSVFATELATARLAQLDAP